MAVDQAKVIQALTISPQPGVPFEHDLVAAGDDIEMQRGL
jgi:hypothetical protein